MASAGEIDARALAKVRRLPLAKSSLASHVVFMILSGFAVAAVHPWLT